jgi:signal transduction histidine kinase
MLFERLLRTMRTASFKLAALYAALFSASVLILGAVIYLTVQASLDRQLRGRVDAEISLLQQEFRSEGLQELVKEVDERTAYFPALSYLVLDRNGNRLTGNLPKMPKALGWSDDETEDTQGSGEKQFRVRSVVLGDGVRLAVGDDLKSSEQIHEALLGGLGSVLLVFLLLTLSGGLLLSRGFLSRVDAITQTAEAIIEGKLSRRVPLRGTDDHFDRLSRTLNHMLDRINALMQSLSHVSAEIAHALRTPLGRLRQKLEVARADARRNGDNETLIDAAIMETDTILDTFSALLRIAQIEAATRYRGFRQLNLSALFNTVADAYCTAAEDEGKQLVAEIEPDLLSWGDRDLLAEMLAALLDNAIRHTPSGTRIELTLQKRGSKIIAGVCDSGPGVPVEERENVLRRFYRLEGGTTTPGNGLGLALVAAVAELHAIELQVGDNDPGLRMTLAFATCEAVSPGACEWPGDEAGGIVPGGTTVSPPGSVLPLGVTKS